MKSFLRLFLISIFFISSIYSQNPWKYTQQLYFPPADSDIVRPFLSTLADDGTLWVISSRIQDAAAHNAIYFLTPGDTVFQKFIDFNNNGDSDSLLGNIGALRGIATLGNTLYVTATVPYPRSNPATVSSTYLYPNFDSTQVIKFGYYLQGSGYGSYNHGCDITKDGVVFAGISFGTTFRCYNFSDTITVAGYGSYIPPAIYAMEPGGAQLGGIDLIRDVALIPDGDYFNTSTPFYTSRNSYSSTQQTGGIAVWTGGTQRTPVDYTGQRILDADNFLAFNNLYPCGITHDRNNLLWVAGVDSTRRWVKAFYMDGIFALPVYDLPSQFSGDIQDPNGAPMTSPSDVAITLDSSTVYVIDEWSRSAFKFTRTAVSVEEDIIANIDFSLEQNYPNPFNPSTLIRFNLPQSSNVKLFVSDILGNEVQTLVDGFVSAGRHTKLFKGDGLSSGIYFYTLITGDSKISKKMTLLK